MTKLGWRSRRGELIRLTPAERFWIKVEKSDGCWLFTGGRRKAGYGMVGFVKDGRVTSAHASRYAYELTHGPVPQGLHVCHRCDNPPCVRPDHLFLGTNGDNIRDAQHKGRRPFGETVKVSRLTDSAVLDIRARRSAGASTKSLADEYSVDRSTVYRALHGRTWSHIPIIPKVG